MVDIIHRVGIKAPIARVYEAVTTVQGVAGWWTAETEGDASLGGTIVVRFRGPDEKVIGEMGMEVAALEPNKHVRWHVTAGPDEWIGTDVTFDLYQDGDYTIVLFGHRNWREPVEFMAHCSMKWATFLLSLRALVETGTGKAAPNDIKIDNWN
jgi:uncharacterized protein YndB with AHSA1/START domain